MFIHLSGHVKRRLRLYKIPVEIIHTILEGADLSDGRQEIIQQMPGFTYPNQGCRGCRSGIHHSNHRLFVKKRN